MRCKVKITLQITSSSLDLLNTLDRRRCMPLRWMRSSKHQFLVMAALWNRAGHYMFALWFLSSMFLSFSFPRQISAVADWMSTILLHMVLYSANLECRSEMCCVRLAGNAGPKKSPSGHYRTNLSGYIFATKARIDNRKILSSTNTSSICLTIWWTSAH